MAQDLDFGGLGFAMPRRRNSSTVQTAAADTTAARAFAAAVAALRSKARVPAAPVTGAEAWTEAAVLARLEEIAQSRTPSQ